MCFSPKIKVPQMNVPQMNVPQKAPEPAPLTELPTGVEFGGDTTTDGTDGESGRKTLKVERKETSITKPKGGPSGSLKSTIRKSAFGSAK